MNEEGEYSNSSSRSGKIALVFSSSDSDDSPLNSKENICCNKYTPVSSTLGFSKYTVHRIPPLHADYQKPRFGELEVKKTVSESLKIDAQCETPRTNNKVLKLIEKASDGNDGYFSFGTESEIDKLALSLDQNLCNTPIQKEMTKPEFLSTASTSCPMSGKKYKPIILSSDDDDEISDGLSGRSRNEMCPVSRNENVCGKQTFLKSLSASVPEAVAETEAIRFRRDFENLKIELTTKLFNLFNEKIFGNKLPENISIEWNGHLLRTAGYFKYRSIDKSATISLSSKIIDCPERLRDTLMHEMCHAAVRLINGCKEGHGPLWNTYAIRCQMAFPEVTIPKRCHNYEIKYKYNYACQMCDLTIGRHTKSLNTSKFVCAKCGGQLKLVKK